VTETNSSFEELMFLVSLRIDGLYFRKKNERFSFRYSDDQHRYQSNNVFMSRTEAFLAFAKLYPLPAKQGILKVIEELCKFEKEVTEQ